jgi:hypothetical protein
LVLTFRCEVGSLTSDAWFSVCIVSINPIVPHFRFPFVSRVTTYIIVLCLACIPPSAGFASLEFGVYYHEGEMPGYQSFMGYDPVNDVTLVIWTNLTLSLEGKP